MTPRRRGKWLTSRIGLRLLGFNALLVFVPIVGILYLGAYERQLLDAQERAMVQQGRVLAAALGQAPTIDVAATRALLARLDARTDARLRIFDPAGTLLADSATLPPASDRSPAPPDLEMTNIRDRWLYRIGVALANVRKAITTWPPWRAGASVGEPVGEPAWTRELHAALAGRYGAGARPTPSQRSMTLASALPIRRGSDVIGAVLVSQSTYRVLNALYDVRLGIFRVVVLSIVAAALLTMLATATIVRPLSHLTSAANALAARRLPMASPFPGRHRRDEIGDLARALQDLTQRLHEQIALLEGLSADIAHEFKNPLAGIRSAAETIDASGDPGERRRFVAFMIRDVTRLERLVTSLRELARVDREAALRSTTTIRIGDLVKAAASRVTAERDVRVDVGATIGDDRVTGNAESLSLVFDNVIANAVSFAPDGSAVDVGIDCQDGCVISVSDRGPGIPPAHLDRVFDRFFSYRPADAGRAHLGLGLAMAKRVVDAHGGSITAVNRDGGGTRVDVRLPALM